VEPQPLEPKKRAITQKDFSTSIGPSDPNRSRWIEDRLHVCNHQFEVRRLPNVVVDRAHQRHNAGAPAHIRPRDASASGPRWQDIAFVRAETATEGRRPSGQIYLLSLEGGEARPLT